MGGQRQVSAIDPRLYKFKERSIVTISAHSHYLLLFIVTTVSLKAPTIVNPEDRMAPRKKQPSPTNNISQVPPPITTTPEEWLPHRHSFAMGPPIHTPSHTRPSAVTLSAPDERSTSTSSTATLPAPGERPTNTSKDQDVTQMPQATSARDKEQRKSNISMYEQEIRRQQSFMQEKQKQFNELQEEFNRAKKEMDRVKGDIDKAEGDKWMVEKLLQAEKKLKQKEEDYDAVVTMFHNVVAEMPRASLASPLQGTKRPHPDESQDRSTRRRTETAKD